MARHEASSKPSRASDMELFAKIFNGFEPLTNFAESSILNVSLGSGYASGGLLEDRLSGIIGELQAFCFHLY